MLADSTDLLGAEQQKNKFEQIYTEYNRLMKHIALEVLKDDALAEDAVQDAFVKIIKHLDDFNEIKCHKTKSFIVVIVRNSAIDILRKEKRQKYISLESIHSLNFFAGGVGDRVIERSNINALLESINGMPTIYREVLRLKIYYDLSDRQIAELLGISNASVRKRLQRARSILTERLEDRL